MTKKELLEDPSFMAMPMDAEIQIGMHDISHGWHHAYVGKVHGFPARNLIVLREKLEFEE